MSEDQQNLTEEDREAFLRILEPERKRVVEIQKSTKELLGSDAKFKIRLEWGIIVLMVLAVGNTAFYLTGSTNPVFSAITIAVPVGVSVYSAYLLRICKKRIQSCIENLDWSETLLAKLKLESKEASHGS